MKELRRFPDFTSICLANKSSIRQTTEAFDSYSDFNFFNLFAWNVDDSMLACTLHDNLVIKFRDYVSGEEFLSFLGLNRPVETARTLHEYALELGISPDLRLIPEITATVLQASGSFRLTNDLTSRDYLLSMQQIARLEGAAQKHTRRLVNKFQQLFESRSKFVELDLSNYATKQDVLAVFASREDRKPANNEQQEFRALSRLLYEALPDPHMNGYGILVDDVLRAFIIIESGHRAEATGHFWKADTSFPGIYHYLLHGLAKVLLQRGITIMNIEQDLGIPGLRQAKEFLRPVGYLHKYRVLPKHYVQNDTAGIFDSFVGSADLLPAGLRN